MRRERPEALPIRSPFNHTIPLDTGKKRGGREDEGGGGKIGRGGRQRVKFMQRVGHLKMYEGTFYR